MSNYNVVINKKNNTGWDKIYPITKASNVYLNENNTLDTVIESVQQNIDDNFADTNQYINESIIETKSLITNLDNKVNDNIETLEQADNKINEYLTKVKNEIDVTTENTTIFKSDNILFNVLNPITYRTPTVLNEQFNKIPFKDENGNIYNVLVEGSKIDKTKDYLSVKDYGAVGDGVNDDTIAIKNCINYALDNNITGVVFPQGIYKITDKLPIITKEITFVGLPKAKIVSEYKGTEPILYFKGNSEKPTKGGCENISITSNTTHSGSIIEAVFYNSLRFTNVILYYGGFGLRLISSPHSFGCYITNCNFSDQSKTGLAQHYEASSGGIVADTFITSLIIHGSKEIGLHITSGSGFYCTNMDIIKCVLGCTISTYFCEVHSIYFANSLFDTSTNENMKIFGGDVYPCNNIRFINCWFSNSQNSYGCRVSKVHYLSLVGCAMLVNKQEGLYITESDKITMSNCNILANTISSGKGAIFYKVKNCSITGNIFGGNYKEPFENYKQLYGLDVNECENTIVTANIIDENVNDGMPLSGNTNTKIINNIGVEDKISA
jgi:hypothetical protein